MSAGKGDKERPIKDREKYGAEMDRIFGHGEKGKNKTQRRGDAEAQR